MNIHHFLLSHSGSVLEFSSEQAALIAAGTSRLPEFAAQKVRYLQISLDSSAETEIRVQTAGASIGFDADGKMIVAEAATPGALISTFEHDTCVQWALKAVSRAPVTFH